MHPGMQPYGDYGQYGQYAHGPNNFAQMGPHMGWGQQQEKMWFKRPNGGKHIPRAEESRAMLGVESGASQEEIRLAA